MATDPVCRTELDEKIYQFKSKVGGRGFLLLSSLQTRFDKQLCRNRKRLISQRRILYHQFESQTVYRAAKSWTENLPYK
jgi:YHS domain-containing protein